MISLEFWLKQNNKKIEELTDNDWFNISYQCKLSEDFIREFADKINWVCLSGYQKLSEDFIREFKNKVKWSYISRNQKLSEEFIKEFTDKISFHHCIMCFYSDKLQEKVESSWKYKQL